ncbi:hypothetical protein KDW_22040 [Dictyobacter vulcani]|uniref:Uncharacterized protein n=1 Tax=Dictyobacter vulcani TaxID=2607529 RepID=A0A5J4KLR5_9CHLR|nr:hypothetical protein [Dictyobacter vulcani]GER88042.1 hypothetical protein KDW_22040 [Dictyobacter vulcani]
MPTSPVRVFLFLSSYFPLFLIFSVLWYQKHFWLSLWVGIASLLSLLFSIVYFVYAYKTFSDTTVKVTKVARKDEASMGYIASYLIPFVTFSIDNDKGQILIPQVLALVVFLLVLLIVYVSSNMIYINPMLNMLGFHLYAIEIEGSSELEYYYLARKRVVRGELITYIRLSDDIFFEH